jgi:predicted ribosome-associated RNA-binding protein Tma20
MFNSPRCMEEEQIILKELMTKSKKIREDYENRFQGLENLHHDDLKIKKKKEKKKLLVTEEEPLMLKEKSNSIINDFKDYMK